MYIQKQNQQNIIGTVSVKFHVLLESSFFGCWPILMYIEWNDWTSCNIVIVNGNRGLRHLKRKENALILQLSMLHTHVLYHIN